MKDKEKILKEDQIIKQLNHTRAKKINTFDFSETVQAKESRVKYLTC